MAHGITINIFFVKRPWCWEKIFWGPSFEDYRAYGLNIPKRLDTIKNMKQQEFITIQEIDICKIAWYKIIELLKLKYMLYKVDCKWGCKFLPHGNKGLHKL
jgi:hypothetical protein